MGTETYIWAADRSDEKEEFIGADVNSPEVEDSTEYAPDITTPNSRQKRCCGQKDILIKVICSPLLLKKRSLAKGRFSRA
jgi:N-acetylmuramoyl-L-alanine amidase